MPETKKYIRIQGAREHNLKNVDLDIPRDALVVFTGLSGSGKSSLAFDTIYAEGQRRYVESLSAYARQFLEMMQKPDVDHIDGLSPAISIEQKTTSQQPALDRRHGHRDLRLPAPACSRASACPTRRPPGCRSRARPSRRWSTACSRCPRARGSICSRRSCAAARASTARSWPSCRRRASSASRSTASSTRSTDAPALDKKFKHDIDVVVDRLVVARRPRHAPGRFASRRRWRSRTAWPSPNSPTSRCRQPTPRARTSRRTRRTSASSSRRASPARSPASPSTRSSRGCSRSTTPSAPARSATASAPSCGSSPSWWCPTAGIVTYRRRRRALVRDRSYLALLRADARSARQATYGVAMSTPWERAAQAGAASDPLRHRRRGRSTFVYEDGVAQLQDHQAVRGRDRQHRAALARDR